MSPQPSIGHYRVVSKLGEGGMGAVYRATDTKLNRDVAIKVLPPEFAQDTARMARFEREAQVLASLNHPNIAAIYGVEQGALVMELVEGVNPAGPLPVETVIDYGRQIAAGLEAAHEKGIVHRDLKPANIKVTPEGVVKLLDFGLAKADAESGSSASPTMSPTLSLEMTQAGMILGTAAYMSPEQARGKTVDRRADIWAYGVILFELLAGRHPFGEGETVTDVLAATVLKEPDLKALPKATPAYLRRLIERCLRKDPKKRLRDIGEARILLEESESEAVAAPAESEPRRAWLPWAVAGSAVAIAAVAAGMMWMRAGSAEAGLGTMRFAIELPTGTAVPTSGRATNWVPSPDGRNLALVVATKVQNELWVRPLNGTTAHRVDKTEGASFPFWSPDGQSIAFFAVGTLKRVALSGGTVQKICDLPGDSNSDSAGDGGAWSRDGLIVFATPGSALWRVSAAGGTPVPATVLGPGENSHIWPQFLPDGRHVLYLAQSSGPSESAIYVQELGARKRIRVLQTPTRAMWSPPGFLLFTRDGGLLAQRMDSGTFQLQGEPASVAEDVALNESNGRSSFAVSQNGILIYRSLGAGSEHQLVWYNRDGRQLNTVGQAGQTALTVLSPDEKNAAQYVVQTNGRLDVWVTDVTSGVTAPMTRDGRVSQGSIPTWSPDSKHLAVTTSDGLLEITVASGQSVLLAKERWSPEEWMPDGRAILVRDSDSHMLGLLSLESGFKVNTVLKTAYAVTAATLSPDADYVAMESNETGVREVYIASFPSFAAKRRVSVDGGSYPQWAMHGQKLFYRTPEGLLMEASVRVGPEIEIGERKPLFQAGTGSHLRERFSVTSDGQRFLLNNVVGQTAQRANELWLVVNWPAEMRMP